MRIIIAMAVLPVLYLTYVLVRPRHECAGNCGMCRRPCHDVPPIEESDDVRDS
jgi:hypothetical protein